MRHGNAQPLLKCVNVIFLIAMLISGGIGCEALNSSRTSDDRASRRDDGVTNGQVISRPRTSSAQNRDRNAERDIDRNDNDESNGGRADSNLYGMSADDFFETRAARKKIELDNVNRELLAAAVFHETNRIRQNEGLSSLRHLDALDEAAMLHAQSMAREGYLSHENRNARLRQPIDRAQSVGLEPRFVAENIATAFGIRYESGERVYVNEEANSRTYSREPNGKPIPHHTYRSFARELVESWMNSPGHRKNILYPGGGAGPTHMGHACVPSAQDDGIPMFYCAQMFYAGR